MANAEVGGTPMTREEVLAEIEGWKQEEREDVFNWTVHLANFNTMLPCELYENGSWLGQWASWGGNMDKKYSDMVEDSIRTLHSPLFLSQTPRELLKTVMDTIRDTDGVSMEKVLELTNKLAEYRKKIIARKGMSHQEEANFKNALRQSMEALDNLYEYVMPVYVALRVMGYSELDLSA